MEDPYVDTEVPATDNTRKRTHEQANGRYGTKPLLKLLVPNYAAGALLGKGGSLLTELQSKCGGNIRLSANREFYPGTDERIVILTGEISEITDLNNHVIEKVSADQNVRAESKSNIPGRNQQVKIVLTNFAAGLLIGKGGETVKAIHEESKAKLSVGQREGSNVPGERVLTMSGSIEQRKEGCRLVLEKIATDESNMKNTNIKYSGASGNNQFNSFNNMQHDQPYMNQSANGFDALSRLNALSNFGGAMGGLSKQGSILGGHMSDLSNQGGLGHMGGHSNQGGSRKYKINVQAEMEVPNLLVSSILGKQGCIIKEIVQHSGAKMKFSGKDEFAPGTTDRILTITGNMEQCHSAYSLVKQRLDGAQVNYRS